jgi:hypothetical protein
VLVLSRKAEKRDRLQGGSYEAPKDAAVLWLDAFNAMILKKLTKSQYPSPA